MLFVQLDPDGKVVRLNAAAEEISGYRQAELKGQSWFKLLVPDDRYPLVWPEFARATSQDELPGIFENPILTRQGEERQILWKSKALFEDHRLVGTISFGIDITERKQAEDDLRESEEKWRRLFAILPVGVSILDAQRTITELNPAFEKILGIDPEGLLNGSYQQRTYLRSDGTPLAFDEFPSVRAVREQRNIEHVEMGVVKDARDGLDRCQCRTLALCRCQLCGGDDRHYRAQANGRGIAGERGKIPETI